MALTYELVELAAVTYGLLVAVLWPIALTRETRMDNGMDVMEFARQIRGALIENQTELAVVSVSEPKQLETASRIRMYAAHGNTFVMITVDKIS